MKIVLFGIFSLLISVNVYSQTSVQWQWSSLMPKPSVIDDPFKKLTKDQLDDLGYYVGLKNDIATIEQSTPSYKKLPSLKAELNELAKHLSSQDVDIDYLLSQREIILQARKQQATAINDEVNDHHGNITGFIVPMTKTPNGLAEFFLVENSPLLAISHDHYSPMPNQVIYIKMSNGLIVDIKKKVTLSGTLTSKVVDAEVLMPDGHETEFVSAYQLNDAVIIN